MRVATLPKAGPMMLATDVSAEPQSLDRTSRPTRQHSLDPRLGQPGSRPTRPPVAPRRAPDRSGSSPGSTRDEHVPHNRNPAVPGGRVPWITPHLPRFRSAAGRPSGTHRTGPIVAEGRSSGRTGRVPRSHKTLLRQYKSSLRSYKTSPRPDKNQPREGARPAFIARATRSARPSSP
jgi:hypothetical protein